MTHLPLTLGEYRSVAAPVTFTRIGKSGKWAFNEFGDKWSVRTGKYHGNPAWNIIARHDPDAELARAMVDDGLAVPTPKPLECWLNRYPSDSGFGSVWGSSRECAENAGHASIGNPVHMVEVTALGHWRQEVGKLHSQLDRVADQRDRALGSLEKSQNGQIAGQDALIKAQAERDEAVALLRSEERWRSPFSWIDKRDAFLAKIGGK